MAVFKCKMCGGALDVAQNQTAIQCDYCGTTQTVPQLNDERRANLYDRANHFRRNNEFDKAASIYEQILTENSTDAEAYWSLILCGYGIEYVEDPTTHKRLPTVNRAQFTSVFDDDNYKSALQYADVCQRRIYEAEAKAINEIQKGILAISQKEEPFDVFICYKETDNNGRRTPDSVLANDLYHQLTNEGFKVFFSRITLEDKLGTAYEPYIFAALNSAKVMVVLGTKPEYFKAVWVRNEWSRYLTLVKQSGGKKILIPAYKDMDPYDLPEEFSHLQAQDMGKLGFMQDLIRGIKKLTHEDAPAPVKETVLVGASTNIAPLLKRAFMFLEDGEWANAMEYCEKVLDMDPECAEAYLAKLMAELHCRTRDSLANQATPFDRISTYQKTIRFADNALRAELTGYVQRIKDRNEQERIRQIYDHACEKMNTTSTESGFKTLAQQFGSIAGYKNADEKQAECLKMAEIAKKDAIYNQALKLESGHTEQGYKEAEALYRQIPGHRDADTRADECGPKIEVARKDAVYKKAEKLKAKYTVSDLEAAIEVFTTILNWKDSQFQIEQCRDGIRNIHEAEERKERARQENERLILEKERLAKLREQNELKRRKKKRAVIVAALLTVIAIAIGVLAYITVIVPANSYNAALALEESGEYSKAFYAYCQLGNYKDASDRAAALNEKYPDICIYIGDTVTFGHYEQDGNKENGKEAIEWIVLAEKDGNLLVISKGIMGNQNYHEETGEITWENCSLRAWINGEFAEEAFTAEELEKILTTTVKTPDNKVSGGDGGNDTQDKLFLLSKEEAEEYFASDAERAIEERWWLRTPAWDSYAWEAVCVGNDGTIWKGARTDTNVLGVRPAMWISLEDLAQ